MDVKKKIQELIVQSKELKKQCPEIDNIMMDILDVPMDQLRALVEKEDHRRLAYSEPKKRMYVQLTTVAFNPMVSIFCFSPQVKVETHIVVDSVKINK